MSERRMPGKVPAPIGLLVIVLTSSPAPFVLFALIKTNFTRTIWIICPGSDKFHLHHLDHLPWFGQISPTPFGSFTLVRTNFTCTIRITCHSFDKFTCTNRIICPGSDKFHPHLLDLLPWF